jgi:glycosyltransferase involved in cell wall biosynthesis
MAIPITDGVVRVVTSDIFAGDAIGNFNLQIRSYLDGLDVPCRLYAAHYDESQNLNIAPYDDFFDEYTESDVLLCHFSIYEERNERLRAVCIPKAVYYHGITPPHYFESYDKVTAENCARGLMQFDCFRDFDFFVANSKYNLDQLLDRICENDEGLRRKLSSASAVCPPFITSAQSDWNRIVRPGKHENDCALLYVGRIAPHKCVHELFELLDALVNRGVDASLHIVGSCAAPSYCVVLENLMAGEYLPIRDRIFLHGHVPPVELDRLYSASDVFVTMSEHEGFCVPLVEAMHFSMPILAKGAGAIPETLSGAGKVVNGGDYDAMADYIAKLADDNVKSGIIAQQDSVYRQLMKASDGSIILHVLEKLLQKRAK